MKKENLRDKMPLTADFVDRLREVFGKEYINDIIRRSLKGEPVFYAEENGIEIGTPMPKKGTAITWDPVTMVSRVWEDKEND